MGLKPAFSTPNPVIIKAKTKIIPVAFETKNKVTK